MKATIYIRKENEEWWKANGSSAWVNEMIQARITAKKNMERTAKFNEEVFPSKAPQSVREPLK